MTTWTGLAPGDGEDNVADHVRIEREARGWSTAELARHVTEAGCPISQSAVWRIESGEPRRKISVDELIAFSRVFGKPIEALLRPPRPEYPSDLVQTYLIQWMDQESKVWDARLNASLAFNDLVEVLRIFPGATTHLAQMLEELLEAWHLTFLEGEMMKTLKSLPQRVAEMSQREPVLHEPVGVVAYWNSVGLSKEEMLKQAEDWGLLSILKPIVERGAVSSNRVLGGRYAPLNRVTLNEQGQVALKQPDNR